MEKWRNAEYNVKEVLKPFFDLHYSQQDSHYSYVLLYTRQKGFMVKTVQNPVKPMSRDEFMKKTPADDAAKPESYWAVPQFEKKVPLPLRYVGFLRTDMECVFDLSQRRDYYLTANGFCNSKNRQVKNLSTVHNLVIDIDCHTDYRYNREDMEYLGDWLHRYFRETTEQDPNFREPNTIVNTGRGFQVWWRFEPFSYSELSYMWKTVCDYYISKVQDMFQNIEKFTRRIYEDFCEIMGFSKYEHPTSFLQVKMNKVHNLNFFRLDVASSRKKSGLFRVPGTFNSKTGVYGSFRIFHDRRIDITDLFFSLHPATGNPYKKRKKSKKSKKTSHWNGFAQKREEDLKKLVEYRQKNGFTTYGYRDLVCLFICAAYCSSGEDDSAAIAAVKRMNQMFDVPMKERELLNYMSSCMHKKYKFGNDYVIQALGITTEEQKILGICTSRNSKKRLRKQEKEERYQKAIELSKKGYTQQMIASETGLSQPTVSRVLKKAASTDSSVFDAEETVTDDEKNGKNENEKCYSENTNIIYSYSTTCKTEAPFPHNFSVGARLCVNEFLAGYKDGACLKDVPGVSLRPPDIP